MTDLYKRQLEVYHKLWQTAMDYGDDKKAVEHMNNYTNNQEIIQLWEKKLNEI